MTGSEIDPTDPRQSWEMVAAALRADSADLEVMARVLTTTLSEALPAGVVTFERDRSLRDRAAGRPGRVVGLQVELGERHLALRVGPGAPEAQIVHTVRGVVLSRRVVDLDEWTRVLAAELTARAERDASARAAIAALLGLR